MAKKMLPLSNANGNLLDRISGETAHIKYLNGKPRQYRFDASKGIFSLKDQTTLTKPGESITIIPLAYRIFRDQILGFENVMQWFEVYFLNDALQICSMLFHGYSVEELLENVFKELFYEDLQLTDVRLTITPQMKVSKSAEGQKYYIASFAQKALTDREKESIQAATADLKLWRDDTVTLNDPKLVSSKNFSVASYEDKVRLLSDQAAVLLESA